MRYIAVTALAWAAGIAGLPVVARFAPKWLDIYAKAVVVLGNLVGLGMILLLITQSA